MWAEADVEHAAWCLEQLARDEGLRSRMGSRAAQDIQRQLSPEAVGQMVRERLQALGHWYPHLSQ
jgi:glycosyltransferase involved in cell wall biosynthesis